MKTWSRWVFTVARPMRSRSAICGFVRPSATSATTWSSVGVKRAPPVARPPALAAGPTRVGDGFAPVRARRPRQSLRSPASGPSASVAAATAASRRPCSKANRHRYPVSSREPGWPRPRAGGTRPRTPTAAATPRALRAHRPPPGEVRARRRRLAASCHRSSSCSRRGLDRGPHGPSEWRLGRPQPAPPRRPATPAPASTPSRQRSIMMKAGGGSRGSMFSGRESRGRPGLALPRAASVDGARNRADATACQEPWTRRSLATVRGRRRRPIHRGRAARPTARILAAASAISSDGLEQRPRASSRHRWRSPR